MGQYVFIDTSGWIALYHKKDKFHEKAIKINKELLDNNYYYITTNFIFDETITALLYKANHSLSVNFGERIQNTENVRIIYITREIENKSWELFKKYSDKEFSFTDCTSFVILQGLFEDKRVKEVKLFASDNHFCQMGYEILL